jgi:hypothetical protein
MTSRALDPTPLLRSVWLVLAVVAMVLATGCAAPKQITPQAASFGSWPTEREPGTFAFERLPSQQTRPAAQDKLEAAATAALERAGFKPAASAAEADVIVVAGSRLTTVAVRDYWDWDPRFSLRGFVGYGSHRCCRSRFGLGASWGYPGFYPNTSASVLEVTLTMRDRKTQQVIHEARARYDRPWDNPRLVEALFDASLKGFPTPAAPRSVTVPLLASEGSDDATTDKEPAAAPAAPAAPASGPDKGKDSEKSSLVSRALTARR